MNRNYTIVELNEKIPNIRILEMGEWVHVDNMSYCKVKTDYNPSANALLKLQTFTWVPDLSGANNMVMACYDNFALRYVG